MRSEANPARCGVKGVVQSGNCRNVHQFVVNNFLLLHNEAANMTSKVGRMYKTKPLWSARCVWALVWNAAR